MLVIFFSYIYEKYKYNIIQIEKKNVRLKM